MGALLRHQLPVRLCRLLSRGSTALLLLGSVLNGRAATRYWDGGWVDLVGNGNGASAGGSGTWDATLQNWDQGSGLSYVNWTNANNDTAVFGGTAGVVTQRADITVGGLLFETSGYVFSNSASVLTFGAASNAIVLNNIAAATLGGTVGGAGDVLVVAANPAIAGTLTFKGLNTNGWSGATTVSPNMALVVDNNSGTNRALKNTSAITINSGSILIANVLGAQVGVDFVKDSAPITINAGGSFGWRPINAGPSYTETNGAVTVNNGQATFLTGTLSSGLSTLVFPSITRNDVSSVLVFSLGNNNPLSSINRIRVNGAGTTAGWTSGAVSNPIVGPWATSGSSVSDYVVFNNDLVTVANVAASAESSWSNPSMSYTAANGATLSGNRQVLALRATGAVQTLNLAGFTLETLGLLNGGSGALVVTNGVLTTPVGGGAGTTNDLFLTAGSANITTYSTLSDNGAAMRVVKSGGNTAQFIGANTYSGGTVLNAGTLSVTSDDNLGATTGGVIVNGNVTLNRPGTGSFSFHPNRTFTINEAATLTFTSGFAGQTIAGKVTGPGNIYLNVATSLILSNANNDFTGAISVNSAGNTAYGFDVCSINDSPGVGPINLGVGTGGGTFRWFGSSGATKTLTNRQFVLSGTTGGGVICSHGASSADNLVIQKDLFIAGVGSKTLTLAGTNTGRNIFSGNIADGPGSVISLTKAEFGTWALSGTNTYSGATQISQANPNSTLIIQGRQALSTNTTVTLFENSTPASTLKLLDDTPGIIGLPNTVTINHQNSSLNIVIFVGNNGTANGGGNPGSGNTGSVMTLNRLNFAGLNNSQPLVGFRAEGENGYRLGLNTIEFPAFPAATLTTMANWTARLIANSANVTITGVVQQLAGSTATNILTFSLDGTNTGSTISGPIRNSADGSPRPLFLSKTGAGTWTLSGSNTFSGTTTIGTGTLAVTWIDDVANPNPLGQSSAAAANLLIGNGAALKYVGNTGRTDRAFSISGTAAGHAGSIEASGTGPISFTSTASPGYGTAAQTRTIKLAGSNTDTNTLAANIADNGGASVSVEKDGLGTWVLSGTSTYTGGATNRAGTLVIGSAGALGGGSLDIALGVAGGNTNAAILMGGAFTVARNIRLASTDNADAGARVLTIGGQTAANSEFSGNIILGTANFSSRGVTLTAAAGGQVTFSGVIQDPTGQSAAEKTNALAITAVTKSGPGTVVFNNVNTYTGLTSVSAGTLKLTGSGSIANSTTIDIGGGGTLDVSTLTAQMTLGSTQALQASGSTATGYLATDTGKGLTLGSTSPLRFTAFRPADSGGAVPLTLAGAGTLTLGANTPVTIVVSNNGVPLTSAGSPYKLIAKGPAGAVATLPGGLLTVVGDGVNGIPSLELSGGELYLRVDGAAAYKIEVAGNSSATVTAGDNANLTVTALDGSGATLSGLNRTITLSFYGLSSSPDGTVSTVADTGGVARAVTQLAGVPNTKLRFVNGVATINGTSNGVLKAYNATGTGVTLHCSDGDAGSASGVGASGLSLTVNFAAAAKLAFGVQPTTTTAGAVITPAVTVRVQDPYGNTVTSDSSSVSISSGNTGFTSSTLSVNVVNGVATFASLRPTTSGSAITLTAADGGLTGATSAAFTVNAAAAVTLSMTSGNNQEGSISTPLASPFVVTVRDTYGNPVSGNTVTFAIATVPGGASGQSLSVASQSTTVNGQASSTLTLGSVSGPYTVTAASSGLSGSPVTFTATAAPPLTGYTNIAAGAWSTIGNWANSSQPPVGGAATVKIVMNEGADGTSVNDLAGALTLNRILQVANTRLELVSSGGSSLVFTNNASLPPAIINANTADTGRFDLYTPVTLGTNLTISSDASAGAISLHSNITETAASSLTISMLSANNVNGAATCTLGGSNSFSGGTTVDAGYLRIGTDYGLGAVPASPTVNLTLNGARLVSSNSVVLHANRSVRLGSAGGSIGGADGNTITIGGQVNGPGGLTVLRPSNSGFTLVLNGVNTYQGTTTIGSPGSSAPVTLQLGNSSALPGAGLILEGSAGATLDLRGYNATVGALTAVNNLAVVDIVSGGGNSTLTVGNGNASSTFEGLIRNTTGTVKLTKIGSGTLALNNTNTYAGATTISAGTLALGVTNAIAASSNISIAAGATLDVSALGDASVFALGTNTTLTASGTGTGLGSSAAVLKGASSGTNSLGSRPVTLVITPTSFNGDATHPALLVSEGALELNNNTITISNNAATPLGAGTYSVIRVTSGVILGTPLAAPVITGSGLQAGSTALLSVNGGDIELVVTGPPPAEADLVIHMVQSTALLQVGDPMGYTITVSNAGPSASGAILVSNRLGLVAGYVSSSGGGTQSAGLVTWSLPALPSGAATTLTLNITAPLVQGLFTNQAWVSMLSGADPVAANNTTSLVAQAQCPGTPTPFMASPGNLTVYANNLLSFSVVASNADCTYPSLSITGKPAAATFGTSSGGNQITGTFSWTPNASDAGTYPVRFYSSNAGSATNSFNILIYVATNGEALNGSGIPLSQTNWHVAITNIVVPSSGNATVRWASVPGVTYDVYSSPNNFGQQTMSWTKEINGVIATDTQQVGAVASTSQKYLQVVPAGFAPGSGNLWAIVKPSIAPGFTLLSAPVSGSDLKFNGGFGTNLAAVLTGDNGGTGDNVGDEVFILNPDGSYSNLYLDASGAWRTSLGGLATHQLIPGQGLVVLRNGPTTVQPRFSGPVGNTLVRTNTIQTGNANLLSFSEGRYLTPGQAFASLVTGLPVGSYDENEADQLIFIDPDGSFRPVQRLPDGTWLDLTTFGSAGYLFTPGSAAFYIRQSSGGTMQVRF